MYLDIYYENFQSFKTKTSEIFTNVTHPTSMSTIARNLVQQLVFTISFPKHTQIIQPMGSVTRNYVVGCLSFNS
jgi:hypothetical protein